jgi:rhamnogalacturonan endolyase
MEFLDRGTVAVPTSEGVMVNWRITGTEYAEGAVYNLYRGDTRIASDLMVSNYLDGGSNGESYSVAAVINGVEQERSVAVTALSDVYFTIPVRAIDGSYDAYEINDASVGDLDGDGEYEIVVKRLSIDATPEATTYHYLEAYEMDGTFLWAINLGPNMLNKVEINFLVYDLDGDGKAEVATRTSDGFTDGEGNYVGDRDGDGQISYRATAAYNSSYYRIHGPDYISIFDGESGREITWDWYIDREPMVQWGLSGMNASQLSHRATKCMWSVAYTDGVNPSFVISRGIYHRIKLEAWHFRNGDLTKEWAFDSDPNGVATSYTGSGFHNLAVGDVDGDGRDEVMYGSMAVDEYGNGMYSTGFGHGDAAHLADINPDIGGLEHFSCLEGANGSTIPGLSLRNAATGSIQWSLAATGDIGRCMSADIDENHRGYEIWGSEGSGIYSSTGELISTSQPTTAGGGGTFNFGVWWDGDVMRELLDRTVITKWSAANQWTERTSTLYNITSVSANNSTKSNPTLMADILGDWREEIIYRNSANTQMVVFVTPHTTDQRMYSLMHDPNYRTAISWQQNSYNQPPNLSFYFGVGMDTPPVPDINIVRLNQAASITLTAPEDGGSSRVNESIAMRAAVEDDYGIEKVMFYVTDASTMTMTAVGEVTSEPYTVNWIPSIEGTYYMVAKVTDSHGLLTNSNIITYRVTAAEPMIFVYEYDNSGDMSWENTNSWTPARLPTDMDTAVIRTGEVQVSSYIGCPVVVEPEGIFREIGNYGVAEVILRGGALKVNTSNSEYGMEASVFVETESSIISGGNPLTLFNANLEFSGSADLTKQSDGTLILQKASPNFRGNWFVEAGTLTLEAAHSAGSGNIVVADTASLMVNAEGALAGSDSLTLQSGAVLTLNAAYDTVNVLKLGDSVVPADSYTQDDFPSYFSGTGTLVVLSGAEPSVQTIASEISESRVNWNPAENTLTVEGGANNTFLVFDARGIARMELFEGRNDISELTVGAYYVVEINHSQFIGRERIILGK